MSFSIRQATPADASTLARLRYEFRSAHTGAGEGEGEFVERCAGWMAERLAGDGVWFCWVAEDGARVVGNVWLQLFEKIPNPSDEPERHAYLTNFYVGESARGLGLGAGLLSTALGFCAARGVHAVILWPTERSRSLYVRHGFSRPDDILELSLANAAVPVIPPES